MSVPGPRFIQGDAQDGLPHASRKQIRGSALLLVGRAASLVLNLCTQIVLIRYLSKLDYGVFAFALSLLEMCSMGAAFGMDKTLARFGAVYHQRKDLRQLFGAFVLATVVTLGLGVVAALTFVLGQGVLAERLSVDAPLIAVVTLLVLLVPANAFGSVALSMLLVLDGAKSVFLRKHLLGPGLKLLAVLAVVASSGSVHAVALALLLAGLCGMAMDVVLVARFMRRERLFRSPLWRRMTVPVREFFGFSLPLLSSDVIQLLRGALVVILLGWLVSAAAAGSFRAVLPIVRLNQLVLLNFSIIFVPLASRLFAQRNMKALGDMYRRSIIWTTVLGFPIFAVCVVLAEPVTVLLFGREYADSSTVLAMLAAGCFFQTAAGCSTPVLKAVGLVRHLVLIDLLVAMVILAFCGLLIPSSGVIGGAVAVCAGVALQTILRQIVLATHVHLEIASLSIRRCYAVTAAAGVAVVATSVLLDPGVFEGTILAGTLTGIVLAANWRRLEIGSMFPEVRRVPFLRRWLSVEVSQ